MNNPSREDEEAECFGAEVDEPSARDSRGWEREGGRPGAFPDCKVDGLDLRTSNGDELCERNQEFLSAPSKSV